MPSVRVVLTDLDDTLFDHHRATRDALAELRACDAGLARWTLDELDARHRELLEALHLEVLAGRLSIEAARVRRFRQLLADAVGDHDVGRAGAAARTYRAAYERSWHPVPGAVQLVGLIKRAGAAVVIITNNSVAEQRLKIDRIGLTPLVDDLVTSEEIGCCKPEVRIFESALARWGARASDAVMIGDAWETDIEGARRIGIRGVWLNRFGRPSPDRSVAELAALEPAQGAFVTLMGE